MAPHGARTCPSRSRGRSLQRSGRSLTVSAGERVAVFQIEAITDQPEDLRLARAFMNAQARGTLSMPDGAAEEWVLVLQRVGAGDAVSQHRWMHAGTARAVDEESTAGTLRALFA